MYASLGLNELRDTDRCLIQHALPTSLLTKLFGFEGDMFDTIGPRPIIVW